VLIFQIWHYHMTNSGTLPELAGGVARETR
jgi:hypothetical protein